MLSRFLLLTSWPLQDFIVFYHTDKVSVNYISYLYFYNLNLNKFYNDYCVYFFDPSGSGHDNMTVRENGSFRNFSNRFHD